ncbi:9738_t:CDS:1, partial [Cetraspora pellucida]
WLQVFVFDKVTKKCKRIIIIALDGIGLFFKKANTPNLDKFFALGASSLKVKTIMPSDSAEVWGDIITGVVTKKYNIKYENITNDIKYSNSHYPSIFKLIYDKFNITVASFATWGPFNNLIEETVPAYTYAPIKNYTSVN